MLGRNLNQKSAHRLWVSVGVLCCALLVLAGIVQAGHIHRDGQAVQSDCTICHAAHVVAQPYIPQSLPRPVRIVAMISPALEAIRPKPLSVFSLFTRPPPVDAAFA
jgi:hypothetical protein